MILTVQGQVNSISQTKTYNFLEASHCQMERESPSNEPSIVGQSNFELQVTWWVGWLLLQNSMLNKKDCFKELKFTTIKTNRYGLENTFNSRWPLVKFILLVSHLSAVWIFKLRYRSLRLLTARRRMQNYGWNKWRNFIFAELSERYSSKSASTNAIMQNF